MSTCFNLLYFFSFPEELFRSTEIESTSQAQHLSKGTDDGYNFLAKILGTSTDDTANKKSAFTDKFHDGMLKTEDLNAEDSDSDFFA